MSARKKSLLLLMTSLVVPFNVAAGIPTRTQESIARQLGWVDENINACGGFYLEQPLTYPIPVEKNNLVAVTGQQGLLSQRGTSTLEGGVSVTRHGQQITANRAFLYRDAETHKLNAIDMIGNVHLREPNTLVIASNGRYDLKKDSKSLDDVLYRTALQDNRELVGSAKISDAEMAKKRKLTSMNAWGKANTYVQTTPKVYELNNGSYTTCPPINPAWNIRARHLVLDKNTGRGYATHMRIYVKEVPAFYLPYINFPIDSRRKTGFLYPKFGGSNKWGPYLQAPFYWNVAPNYDLTTTPALLSKRGVQLINNFRYLSSTSKGNVDFSILPNDQFFSDFKWGAAGQTPEFLVIPGNSDPIVNAELQRLNKDSTTRKGFLWRDNSQYNDHWSSEVHFNYASDDYYMQDFGTLNEVTENQLLQEADINYKSENWNFTSRVQAYQTLHPLNASPIQNQYRRVPQLILNGDYPDQRFGLEYFINNEITHFEILKTPGTTLLMPIGNRLNVQPGVNLPLYWPYFYINPRAQIALTNYSLHQTTSTDTPNSINRGIPIFDVLAGVSLNRKARWFSKTYQQTLEPQVYYTYIPYRNQADIPLFDTTVNTLTYDQIFTYNRFSGLDRIGDANQMGLGTVSRLIDQETGLEKVRAGIGTIFYFADRRVTLCTNPSTCTNYSTDPSDHRRISPITGLLNYNINVTWSLSSNVNWDPITREMINSSTNLHYQPDDRHIINLGYGYARNGNPFSGLLVNTSQDNLKLTDFSFTWPIVRTISGVGRWTQDWNTNHFQNLLYGLQYDTCCWAVRLVGGRSFVNFENDKPQYNSEIYVQFALKGFSSIGPDPTKLLSSVSGYNTQTLFG